MSRQEREAAQAQVRDAAARFAAECERASEDRWRARPASAHWSMAEVAEHVAISNRNIGHMLAKRLIGSPREGRATGVIDAEIPYLFYRGDEPPNVATPTGSLGDGRAAAAAVDASARAILAWAGEVTTDLRAVAVAHPVFGLLDGVQWLLFAAAHMERHRAQLIGLAGPRDPASR